MPNRLIIQRLLRGGSVQMVTLPKRLLTAWGTTLSDFENANDWSISGAGASKADDTTNFQTGTQSVQLTTGVGVTGRIYQNNLGWDLSSMNFLVLNFYCAIPANVFQITVQVTSVLNDYTNSHRKFMQVRVAGWNYMAFRLTDFEVVGAGANWASINTFRISVETIAGQSAVVSFDSLYLNPTTSAGVMFTFDDSDPTVYTQGYSYMKLHHIPGTFYVITNNVGGVGKVTQAQLTEMYANRWDIANHTSDHTDLTTLSQADAQTKLTTAQTALNGWGFTRADDHVAYPGGGVNDTVRAAMAATGMLTGRNIAGSGTYPLLPLQRYPTDVQISRQLGNTVTLATAEGDIDNAITQGGVCVFLLHTLVAVPVNGTQWAISDFQALIDYIVSKKTQIYPITISEYYSLITGTVTHPAVI